MSNVFKNKDNWRKLAVRRSRKYEPLVEKLSLAKDSRKPVFNYIKDLMVFAAMVGHSKKQRLPLTGETVPIILETYASDEKDAFIFLIALMEERDAVLLKDENLPEAIKIFEEYCNAGLAEIQLWLDENPADLYGIDTLMSKIMEKAVENENSDVMPKSPEEIEVEF